MEILDCNLHGSWKLRSFEIVTEGVSSLWRAKAHGILIYSPYGYMSVSINSEQGTDEWVDSVLFYAGTYRVEGGTVVHDVTNATSASRMGSPMVRAAVLQGDELELSASGDFGKAVLVWGRA